ncbi:MAG: trehalose-phosphatase [Gammaproteobacteria bacterium]|nr:trehalose-phosphatase [Gammaproteobacteria bacterium]
MNACEDWRISTPFPTADPGECALLLDVDGTLVPFAPTPDEVRIDAELLELLASLRERTAGALALVSGRSIDSLDALFAPLRLPASGVHGVEVRGADGVCRRRSTSPRALEAARPLLTELTRLAPGLFLEDKHSALALHYRQAPQLELQLASAAQAIARRIGDGLQVLRGNLVLELAPAGISKATGILELMAAPPFKGRRAIFLGDDPTDEPAFACVNAAGGLTLAVAVTHPTVAHWRLPSVAAARAWLRTLLDGTDERHDGRGRSTAR